MREPERTPEYRKDPEQERHLKNLNALLTPLEEQLISHFDEPQLPIVFIVGVPRSGSTLIAQVLAQTGAFSYITNFVARFWMAPYTGMLIQDALGIRDTKCNHSYVSKFGVTEGWTGPHEFGYFWSRWFPFGETHKLGTRELAEIDRSTLQKEVAALESVCNKPLFFKNMTCGLQIGFLAKLFGRSLFVLCRRHPLYNMQSLLLARESIFGDKHYWCSLRPKEYSELIALSPYEQVAGQVYYILKDIETSSLALSPGRFLQIQYDKLCAQPRNGVDEIIRAARCLGASIDWEPEAIPERFESTDCQRVSDEEFQKLCQAAKRYFESDDLQ
jgi:hypothetical protein